MNVESIDVDLRAVCEEVRKILQLALGERDLSIAVSYDAALPSRIKGDPVRIRQVVLNLAGNAVKFTERGTVRIEVSLVDSTYVKVSVIDSGIGISAEQLQRMFRQFTQADSSTTRRYGGTGLGLAISKTLVELMGGTIGVHSQPGRGSTFWFTVPLGSAAPQSAEAAMPAPAPRPELPASPLLPAALPPALPAALLPLPPAAMPPIPPQTPQAAEIPVLDAAVDAPQSAPTPTPTPTPTSTANAVRLLLVEDNFVNQRVAVYMLTKLGHEVEVARHGREAIEMLSRSPYDLVLMDCQMPEMDGFEATRIIRDPASSVLDHAIPVIAMTANAFPDDRARALASGMNDFLAKPVDRAILTAALEKWLKPASPHARCATG